MAETGVIAEPTTPRRRSGEPLIVASRAFDNEAPYFVDYVSSLVDEKYGGLLKTDAAVDVYTTLDLHLQRLAQEALAEGMAQVDKQLAARKRQGQAQAALVAVDPRTGEILALVGGRAYSQSQYNRAVARPAAAGFGVQAVRLSRGVRDDGRAKAARDLTPATIVVDEPTTFKDGEKDYTPANYQNEYDGPITLRRALAHSRNIVADQGRRDDRLRPRRGLWKRVGVGAPAKRVPVDRARRLRSHAARDDRGLHAVHQRGHRPAAAGHHADRRGRQGATMPEPPAAAVGRAPDDDLPRHEHDAERAQRGHRRRRARAGLHARRGRQDRHDQRSARRLVHRLHAGAADGRLGRLRRQPADRVQRLAGRAADLDGVHEARARRPAERAVRGAAGVEFATIDADTGQLATPNCPRVVQEAFLAGTRPDRVLRGARRRRRRRRSSPRSAACFGG